MIGGRDQPLSINQEARLLSELWARKRSGAHRPFHSVLALRLRGPLKEWALHAALRDIARRHDALRTGIAMADGRAAAQRRTLATVTIRPDVDVPLRRELLDIPDEPARRLAVHAIADREFEAPFVYSEPPL